MTPQQERFENIDAQAGVTGQIPEQGTLATLRREAVVYLASEGEIDPNVINQGAERLQKELAKADERIAQAFRTLPSSTS